jgi:hypothetical protein
MHVSSCVCDATRVYIAAELLVCRCSSSGACACFVGFTGEHCHIEASSKECHIDADCAPGRVCDVGTGMCFGNDGTCGAVQTCDMDTTCNGNGRYLHAFFFIFTLVDARWHSPSFDAITR